MLQSNSNQWVGDRNISSGPSPLATLNTWLLVLGMPVHWERPARQRIAPDLELGTPATVRRLWPACQPPTAPAMSGRVDGQYRSRPDRSHRGPRQAFSVVSVPELVFHYHYIESPAGQSVSKSSIRSISTLSHAFRPQPPVH